MSGNRAREAPPTVPQAMPMTASIACTSSGGHCSWQGPTTRLKVGSLQVVMMSLGSMRRDCAVAV